MRHSDFVESIVPFHNWNQKISALASGDRKRPSSLSALLPSSPGALVVKRYSKQTNNSSLTLLQHDLERRLKFNWIVSRKPAARTVAVVGGRPMYDEIQGVCGSRGFFEAAQALGMSLVVFDEPNHWLKKEKYSHLCREFIPMDMSNITELPRRMADALKDKHVDGIVTFTDSFVIATAEAAEILGLPTEPLSSMQKAHYKHEMRRLVNKTNIQAMHLTSVDQLEDGKMQKSFQSLKYPLIVKPSHGQFSRGVKKVGDDAAMRQAILFLEVTDNLPCPGDKSAATSDENFVETVQISNSGLPANELSIIRNSLHDSLLQLGFRSGVFHVEARMQNSCMQYQDLRGDNILDLAPVSKSREQETDVFLIEINARSPGTAGTWATLYTYGVDMGALQLLHAVGDAERFACLSQPFSSTLGRDVDVDIGGGGGAQYWNAQCMIPVHRDRVFVPPGFVDMVLAEIPHVSAHVSRAELYAEARTFVSPGDSAWVAYFLLFSKVDRRHLLEMYHLVAQVSRRILDEQMEDRQNMMLSV
ncbi:carnosine synthase 1 [Fusarium sp. NRRL 25303]|nr:carnosine synthase 1 [Fusarium sp. NRRL 25303]